MAAGKAVLIDKPLAGRLADMQQLQRWVREGARISGGSSLRFTREAAQYLARPEDERGQIFWRGPVLAGNRLILTSSRGQMAYVSPVDGTILGMTQGRAPFSLPPVVANGTLYVLDDTGRLTAWR